MRSMIYLATLAVILAMIAIYRRTKLHGWLNSLLDVAAAAVSGWIAGLLLGIGARIGMWAIPFFNGTESSFSFDGSLSVVLTFSLFGIGLGIFYEFVFRELLRRRGLLYGLLISLITVYPLGSQGVEQLNFSPSILPLAFSTFFFIVLMFIPFAIALEFVLGQWHRFHDVAMPTPAVPAG